MTSAEQLEQLEKQEKELDAQIKEEKEKTLKLDRQKTVLQNLCEKFQMTKAEQLDELKKLGETNKKLMQSTDNEYKRKFQELDMLIGQYHNPEKKALFKLNLVRERRKYIEERWAVKEAEYIRQLAELKEQIVQLRSRVKSYILLNTEPFDHIPKLPRTPEDSLSHFLSSDPIKSLSFQNDDTWKSSILNGTFDKRFDQELMEKEDRVNTLSEDCRKLQQRRAMLIKQLKQNK